MEAKHTAKRIEVLRASLAKKQSAFDSRLSAHIASVKEANGQPLNDKRNGQATLTKWDRQNDALRKLDESMKKTSAAIEKEESKVAFVEYVNDLLPQEILTLVAEGVLIQWRKHPNTFFVVGVEKARIVWDEKRKIPAHRYVGQIPDKEQHRTFAKVYNELNAIFGKAGAT